MFASRSVRLLGFAVIIALFGILVAAYIPGNPIAAEEANVDTLGRFKADNFIIGDPSPSPTPEAEHWHVAAYYDLENFPSAKFLLNNKDIVAREVRPTLYSLDGLALEVPPVWVGASSAIMIDLEYWAEPGGIDFRRGSIKIFHTGKDRVIGSQVYLEDTVNGLSFEERLAELGKFNSLRLEGIWYMPRNQTDATIILSNTSDQMLTVNAKLSKNPRQSGVTEQFLLLPHQTRVLDLKTDFQDGVNFALGRVVGLSLTHNGNNSDLKAHGLVKDFPKGYSNIIQFSNPDTAKSSEFHGTGLHLGQFGGEEVTPVVIAKNVGAVMTNITAKVNYTRVDGTTGSISLNPVGFRPGEMRPLNMDAVIHRAQKEQIEIAGIEVSSDTAPGSIIVSTQSIGEDLDQVYRVPMYDPYAQVSSTGGYPWRIDATSSTYAYIKNTTSEEQEYVSFLTWENGEQYMIGLDKIAPGQTVQIDVKKLRDMQIPDERGGVIPANVNEGQIKWTIRSEQYSETEPLKKFELVGRSEQIDLVNKTSSSYACQNCCQKYAFGWISSDGVTEAEVGDQIQFTAFEQGMDCHGTPFFYQLDNDDVNWDSSNSGIGNVSNTGLVTITGVGNVEVEGSWWVMVTDDFGGWCPLPLTAATTDHVKALRGPNPLPVSNLNPDCDSCFTINIPIEDEKEIEAKPKVTINVPSSAVDGSTVNFSVTVTGATPTGTPTAYQWSFTPPSGSGNNPQVNFTTPTAATTSAVAHWFANPNSPCPTNPPITASHPYYNSKYEIKVKVTFPGGRETTKDDDMKVNAAWFPAGEVGVASMLGVPTMQQISPGTWGVVGPGSLSRSPQQTPNIYVPSSSQFYNKTVVHENVHIGQWGQGQIFQNYVTVAAFMARIANITETSQARLIQRLGTELDAYRQAERNRAINSGDRDQAEIDAYAVSDPVAPMFAYQRCGRTTF